jgi:FixJ family two-component response regulator
MDLDRSGVEASVSEREIEIIGLVAQGLTDQEIAQALTISKRTVDNHVSNIFTNRGQEPGGPAELGHGQRQDLPRRLQLLQPWMASAETSSELA